MITLERVGQIVTMDWEELFNGIKNGTVSYEEFEYWLEDRRDNWISDGMECASDWTDFR